MKCKCCGYVPDARETQLIDGLCEVCELDRLEREYDDDLNGDVEDYDY